MNQKKDLTINKSNICQNSVTVDDDENFLCAKYFKVLDQDKIFIAQYRYNNKKYCKGFIVNTFGDVIWSSKYLESQFNIVNINITNDHHILLQVTGEKYDVLELNLNNTIINTYSIKKYGISKLYYINKTHRNSILLSAPNENKILELSESGELIFEYNPGKEILNEPRCVHLTDDDNYLICDSKNHYVILVNHNKEIIWTYGQKNNPGYSNGKLMYPYMASKLENGNYLIVEHQASRVTEINENKEIVWQFGNTPEELERSPRKNYLNGPTYAECIDNNNIISDSMNGRIISINRHLNECKLLFGKEKIDDYFVLNYPRSVQMLKNGNMLIADSRNNRVIEIDKNYNVIFEFGNKDKQDIRLKWPRCAYKDESNNYIYISDGFNKRIVVIDEIGGVKRIIDKLILDSKHIYLRDPHSVYKVDNSHLLITDSDANFVSIINNEGKICWMYNDERYPIRDPHCAIFRNNKVFIADTNNNRILIVDVSSGKVESEIDTITDANNSKTHLCNPKWISLVKENILSILDSKNHRIIELELTDESQKFIRCLKVDIFNSRCVFKNNDTYYISDFWRHKIIKLK